MSTCGRWCVALFVLANIVSFTVGENIQDNEIQNNDSEDGNHSPQRRDTYGQSNQQIVNVKIPACNPKTEYVTTVIRETLAVRSHCVQKLIYSSTREVVSTSTECKGYMCNPKIPYVYSEDYRKSEVEESYPENYAPEYGPPKQNSEIYDNSSSIPYGNYTMPDESYSENYTPEYGLQKQSSKIYDNPSSIPYGNYTMLDESYLENYTTHYRPPKQSSETYNNLSYIPNRNYIMPVESYPENYTPEYGPPKKSSVYKYLDYGVLYNSVAPKSTTPPTTTTTISYKEPSSSYNNTGILTQITSRLRDSFLRGFFRTDDRLKKSHLAGSVIPSRFFGTDDLLKQSNLASSVTPSKTKPTYFTAVVKDPGHVPSISNEIYASRPIPQITPHSSTYQPTSIDLTAYSDFVRSLVERSSYENITDV